MGWQHTQSQSWGGRRGKCARPHNARTPPTSQTRERSGGYARLNRTSLGPTSRENGPHGKLSQAVDDQRMCCGTTPNIPMDTKKRARRVRKSKINGLSTRNPNPGAVDEENARGPIVRERPQHHKHVKDLVAVPG
ncbi:urease subunit alpha [Striga asiatica]|uniref:Urease subunit alpha n=1 Tax=Striga asiatica TaxID=4170 RepID=A0A5A7R5M1_STRAF|nr:urease subunit alpha [Striga asiatica]